MNAQRIRVAALLAPSMLVLAATPASAQSPWRETPESQAARQDYERQRQDYQDQRDRYDAQQQDYSARRDAYQVSRRNYREARRDYDRRLAEWERARAIYDGRYGYGAYARMYARPVWDEAYWTRNAPPPYAGNYGRNASTTAVRCSSDNTVAGGVLGALAGAILGSQVASHGARTEGAVLGGVAGAVIGGSVGNASSKDGNIRCDSRGPYFTYDQTMPYRVGRQRYASAYDNSYYTRQRCRLAAAPVDAYERDYRYVRVCPDEDGRYRITG